MAAGAPPLANYDALPTDVLHDILLRLPADEVCRLQLVCRSWWSLTSAPLFARAHALRHPAPPHVVVVHSHDEDEAAAAEVRVVDLHGRVIRQRQIQRRPIEPQLSVHGDLLCASHGWGLTRIVDMVTGNVTDMVVDPRKKVNRAAPHCVIGYVPATGEYKVLRIQADYGSRRERQTCEVMTLGSVDGGEGRWRRLGPPPAAIRIPWCSSWTVAVVVAGLAYFLVNEHAGEEANNHLAVFDLATEEWKPTTLPGPSSSLILASMDDEEEDEEDDELWGLFNHPPILVLFREHFHLTRLGESLVLVYCNVRKGSTELWFMEGMEDDTMTAHWRKRYTLQGTPFGDNTYVSVHYHYPLAVLDDGRILVWVERTSALRAYDPETCTWTDLATLTGDCVVGMHHGSLLRSYLGVAEP